MECKFCGEEITEGALACPRCGSPAPKPAEAGQAPPPAGGPPAQGAAPPRTAAPPPWEVGAAPASPGGPQAAPPPPGPAAPPPGPVDVPLAKQEEDFIALAEEMVSVDQQGGAPGTGPAPGEAAVAGVVNPAVPDERVALDGTLTGGFKGEAAGGSSVAGAGEQTADDPFGLNITETAPPTAAEASAGRRFNFRSWWNILIMFAALIVAGAVAFTGIYFGFLREKGLSPKEPVAAVQEYVRQVVSGDTSMLDRVSVPGSAYQAEIVNATKPYEKQGVISVKEFEADTASMNETGATVVINKLTIEILTTGDTTETANLLAGQPVGLRNTVTLIRQNGRWLVSN